jgi:hypothetical protein
MDDRKSTLYRISLTPNFFNLKTAYNPRRRILFSHRHDFHPRNIMVVENQPHDVVVSGIIDWADGTRSIGRWWRRNSRIEDDRTPSTRIN